MQPFISDARFTSELGSTEWIVARQDYPRLQLPVINGKVLSSATVHNCGILWLSIWKLMGTHGHTWAHSITHEIPRKVRRSWYYIWVPVGSHGFPSGLPKAQPLQKGYRLSKKYEMEDIVPSFNHKPTNRSLPLPQIENRVCRCYCV